MADQNLQHDGDETLPLPALPAPPPPPPPPQAPPAISPPYTRSGTMAAVIEEEDEEDTEVDASMPTPPPAQPELLPPPLPPPSIAHAIPPAEAAQLDQITATTSTTNIMTNSASSSSISASAAAAAKQKRQSLYLGGINHTTASNTSNIKNPSSSRALSSSSPSASSSFPLGTHPSFRSRFQRTARLTGKGMERSLAHVKYWGKAVVETLLHSILWDMLLFLVTLYMLTGETWRLLYVRKEDDHVMEACNVFALSVVVLDLFLRVLDSRSVGGTGGGSSSSSDDGRRVRYLYLTSFQFWMDFLSMLAVCYDVGLWYFSKQHWPVWDLDKQVYFAVGEALRVLCLLRLAHLARWVNMEKLVFCGCGGGRGSWSSKVMRRSRRRRRGQEKDQDQGGGERKSSSITNNNNNHTIAGGQPSRQSSSKVAPMLGEMSSASSSRRGWSTRSSSSFRDSSASFSDTHNNNNNNRFSLMATSLIKSLRWTSRRYSSNSTNISSRNLDDDAAAAWGNNSSSNRRQTKQQPDSNHTNNNNPASSFSYSISSPAAAAEVKSSHNHYQSKSRVGAKFLEVTLRKVIIVIVLLCLCFPLLSPSRFLYAHPVYRYHKFGLQQLHALAEQIYPTPTTVPTPAEEALLKANLQDYMTTTSAATSNAKGRWSRPLYLKLQNVPLATTNQWLQEVNVVMAKSLTELQSQYRPIEIPRYRLASSNRNSDSDSDGGTEAFFFGQPRLQDCSRRNMELRLCVLVLFFLVGALFTGAQKIVIAPIERMTKIVTLLKENPLAKLDKRQHHHQQHHSTKKQKKKKALEAAAAAADTTPPTTPTSATPTPTPTTESPSSSAAAAAPTEEEQPKLSPRSLTLWNALKSSLSKRHLHYSTNKSHQTASVADAATGETEVQQSEMDLLENVLVKISELLQIGFGAAGAELISKNMIPGSTDVKQLLSLGKRKQCIFGFVKIEDFSVMCGCLQEDVCTYINTIAKVVHGNVMEFQGAPNKNTGNAFFCVWKMKDSSSSDQYQHQQQQDGGAAMQAAREPPPPPPPLSPLSSSPSPRVFEDNTTNNNRGSVSFQQQPQQQQQGMSSPSDAPPLPSPSPSAPAPAPTPTPRSGRFMPNILPLLSSSLTSPFSPRTVAAPPTTAPPSMSSSSATARMSSSRVHPSLATLADKALASVVKTRVELHCLQTHPDLTQFSRRPAVAARLGEEYAVKLQFGLHLGWAIEGALGSQYKIDATYLSPHVNLASRLEAATHQFGTLCLMSGDFVSQLSPAIRLLCRQLDVVTVKGSEQPLEIWTFDITDWPDDLSLFRLSSNLRHSMTTSRRTSTRHHGNNNNNNSSSSSQRFLINGGGGAALTEQDLALVLQQLQRSLNPLFLQHHSQALRQYLAGEWDKAHQSFTQALTLQPNDGPTSRLLQVLEGNNRVAPEGWNGCRKLHGK